VIGREVGSAVTRIHVRNDWKMVGGRTAALTVPGENSITLDAKARIDQDEVDA
jgi:hypothetical protein